jgi:hypothetical protein
LADLCHGRCRRWLLPPFLLPSTLSHTSLCIVCVCVCVCVRMCSSSVQFRNSGDGERGRELAHAPSHCACRCWRMPSSSMRSSVRRASVCMRLRPCIFLTRYCVWLCLAVGFGQLDRARYVSNCRPGILNRQRPIKMPPSKWFWKGHYILIHI